jgi:transposase
MIYIPKEEDEAVRDLIRARETAVKEVRRTRHYLGKFLLRHGHRYRDGKQWTLRHEKWMKTLQFEKSSLQTVFEEYQLALEQAEDRVKRLTRAIKI